MPLYLSSILKHDTIPVKSILLSSRSETLSFYKMWELQRKLNDVRITRKFANCQIPKFVGTTTTKEH
ncbi:hypothetical protein E4412_19470 [Leptospira interrogans]|nr:hypothetical protein E4412_19470 [Leptospira interrogans]